MGILTTLLYGKQPPEVPPSTSGLKDDPSNEQFIRETLSECGVANPSEEEYQECLEHYDTFMAQAIFYKLPKGRRASYYRTLFNPRSYEREPPYTRVFLFIGRVVKDGIEWLVLTKYQFQSDY